MKTNIYIILATIAGLFLFSTLAVANGKETEKPPENKTLIRVYCFYVPHDKAKLPPEQQISSALYQKLLDPDSPKSKKILAVSRASDFAISEEEYYSLYDECQEFVKAKGQILELKATDARSYETLSRFYRLSILNFDEPSESAKQVLALDDPAVLKEVGIDGEEYKDLRAVLTEKSDVLHDLANKLDKTHLASLVAGIKSIAGNSYVTSAFTLAAFLASVWFAPAYVGAAVDVLYPLVYQALWGIPSKFGLSYWLIYYPGKMHAVAWAYNNSQLIVGTAATLLGLLTKGYYRLTDKFEKKEIAEKLDSAVKDIEVLEK